MNIVMLSEHDYAGSGWQIAQAIRRHTDHSISHVKVHPHKYGYETDFLLNDENRSTVQNLVDKADIVHFKGDDLPVKNWHGIRIPRKAKIILTVGGSGFRRHGSKSSGASMGWHSVEQYIKISDFRTTLSPDLNYQEFYGYYTPYVTDSDSEKYLWSHQGIMSIGYYPGRMGQKGDRTHIIPALNVLKKEFNFKTILFQKMNHTESVRAKTGLTVFIDQISEAGCYGNSGVEAMQFGIPVIAYISDRSTRQSHNEMFRKSPVLNPGPDLDGLIVLLRGILSGKINLKDLSMRTKHYCDEFHGYRVNGGLWDNIYRKVADGRLS